MKNKCNKFEAISIFVSDEDFLKHIVECADCQEEYLKMNKISSLVKEVAPIYFANEKKMKLKKIMSCCLFLFFGVASIVGFEISKYNNGEVSYSESSIIYDMGCPVDDYGLLKI